MTLSTGTPLLKVLLSPEAEQNLLEVYTYKRPMQASSSRYDSGQVRAGHPLSAQPASEWQCPTGALPFQTHIENVLIVRWVRSN